MSRGHPRRRTQGVVRLCVGDLRRLAALSKQKCGGALPQPVHVWVATEELFEVFIVAWLVCDGGDVLELSENLVLVFGPVPSREMPSCCPCNTREGALRCKNCICKKSGRACTSCAPGRLDPASCQNRPLPIWTTTTVSSPLSKSFSAVASTPPPSSPP